MHPYSRSVKAYYDRRAAEYDEWYYRQGQFAVEKRPGWDDDLGALTHALAALPPHRTLDVACGTGFLTQHLRGDLTCLDQSAGMLAVARQRLLSATFVQADALAGLPFADASFERLLTGHFYGHLEPERRVHFLAEARRVSSEIVVVDSALRDDVEPEETQERVLNDGSRWSVYKRYFTPQSLVEELGGGETMYAGRWFVAVRA